MSKITTTTQSVEFLTKKSNVLKKRMEFLNKMAKDLSASEKVISEKQMELARKYAPYVEPTIQQESKVQKTNLQALPNQPVDTNYWTCSGNIVSPSRKEVQEVLPQLISKSTHKFLAGLFDWQNLSTKQEAVLVRIWDEIKNKGMYTI